MDDDPVTTAFQKARFAFCTAPSRATAAVYLKAAMEAEGDDLIDGEERDGVLYDVIEYLEGRRSPMGPEQTGVDHED